MEYWEFLIQKEGERFWLPIKSPKIEIEAGRYRVVAHSNLSNINLEVCVTHESTGELPPRRRSQKRSRCTNQEGLMVVLPFTDFKSGLWRLRCSSDIMSDLMGNSWQQVVVLSVLPKTQEVLPTSEARSPGVSGENYPNSHSPDLVTAATPKETPVVSLSSLNSPAVVPSQVKECGHEKGLQEAFTVESNGSAKIVPSIPVSTTTEASLSDEVPRSQLRASQDSNGHQGEKSNLAETSAQLESASAPASPTDLGSNSANPRHEQQILSNNSVGKNSLIPEPEQQSPNKLQRRNEKRKSSTQKWAAEDSRTSISPPATVNQSPDSSHPPDLEEEMPQVAITNNSAEVSVRANPIFEQSLQMLEEVLQEVVEPVLQEFEYSDSQELRSSFNGLQLVATSDSEAELDIFPEQQWLTLSLNQEALVAHRGEPLTVTGKLAISDVNQSGDQIDAAVKKLFPANLRYQLRDPQTSQVLLDVDYPLSEQSLPLAFSHTLEIPTDFNTRLILGKLTVYDSSRDALVSQPFSITADLEELLGSIIPGSKAMPLVRVLSLTDNLAAYQENQVKPKLKSPPPLNQDLLNFVNATDIPDPLPLQTSVKPVFPPKLEPRTPPQSTPSSLKLPKLPKVSGLRPAAREARPWAFLHDPELTVTKAEDHDQLSLRSGDDYLYQIVLNDNQVEVIEEPVDSLLLEELEPDVVNDSLASGTPLQEPAAASTHLESQVQEDAIEWFDAIPEQNIATDTESSLSIWDEAESPEMAAHLDAPRQDAFKATADSEVGQSEVDASLDDTELWLNDANLGSPSPEIPTITSLEATEESETDDQHRDSETTGESGDDAQSSRESTKAVADQEEVTDTFNALENSFGALNIQDRFWSRLNSLVTDVDFSESMKPDSSVSSNLTNPERVTTLQPNSDTVPTDFDESIWEETDEFGGTNVNSDWSQPDSSRESVSLDREISEQPSSWDVPQTQWEAQEIVIEDDQLQIPMGSQQRIDDSRRVNSQGQLKSQLESETIDPRQLDLPVPAPVLLLPTSELVAGEPVAVRIKLPPHPARLYVKLWLQDRQSRALLDGPRSLVDFIPNNSGELEALTQLIVPFSSVEIRFEAITVDIFSQRESRKVGFDCVVVHDDLSDDASLSLDDL
ncbi:hypothetical protein [Lyngbya aestuarii]|uniref:hypothetical protein n=1 Tax=Lyngbya aestuarii TaxID=118322 RepID=UPI00403D6BCD